MPEGPPRAAFSFGGPEYAERRPADFECLMAGLVPDHPNLGASQNNQFTKNRMRAITLYPARSNHHYERNEMCLGAVQIGAGDARLQNLGWRSFFYLNRP
jgi:hypothetical protein